MSIEWTTVTLPAHWASALVNGDESGMSKDEIAHMDAYLATALDGGWYVASVWTEDDGSGAEPWFTSAFRLYGGDAEAGNVLTYVIHREAVPRSHPAVRPYRRHD